MSAAVGLEALGEAVESPSPLRKKSPSNGISASESAAFASRSVRFAKNSAFRSAASGQEEKYTLQELLPHAFTKDFL